MIERPVSVLRSVLRQLAGDQCSRLSVSFGEAVPAAALRKAWQALAAARPRLRCGYRKIPGAGLRAMEDAQAAPEWRELDWSGLSTGEVAARWRAELDGAKAPDASLAPPLRLTVITLPDRTTHLLAAHPQFVFDEEDWFDILCGLLEALSGQPPQPADSAPESSEGAPLWRELLDGFTPSPLKFYGPEEAGEFQCEMLLERAAAASFAAACRDAGGDPASAVLACWSVLLARLTGNRRPLLWVPAGETPSLFQPFRLPALKNPGLREMMTAAVEQLHRRAHSPPETLESLGLQPGDAVSLVRFLPPSLNDRISDALPRWVNLDARLHSPPLHPLELTLRAGARFELGLRGGGLPRETAARLLNWLRDALDGLVGGRRAAEIPLCEETATPPAPPPEPAPTEALFSEAAAKNPDALAIEDTGGAALTFREVEDYASLLSAWLCGQGLGEGWIAGVCLSPSPWVPVAWIAVLRAGNTLLPLDPAAPPEWLRKKAADSDAQFVICDSSTAGIFQAAGCPRVLVVDQQWEAVAATPLLAKFPAPARLALVLGGTPAGPPPVAAVPRAALASANLRFGRLFDAAPGSRVEVAGSPGTGDYADTLLGALVSGATAVFPGATPGTHLRATPGALRARLAGAPRESFGAVRSAALQTRGEPLDLSSLKLFRAAFGQDCRIVTFASPCDLAYLGLYGPAEPGKAVRGLLPCGKPSRASGAAFTDCEGRPPPSGFPGTLAFQIPGAASPLECMRAWRDAEGNFHILPEDEEAQALTVAALSVPGVLDAALLSNGTRRLLYVAAGNLPPEQLAGKLALAAPGRPLPRDILRVDSIPRPLGLADGVGPQPENTPLPSQAPETPTAASPATPAPQERDPRTREPAPAGAPRPSAKSAEPPGPAAAGSGSQNLLLELAGHPESPRLVFVHASGRSPRDCDPLLPFLGKEWLVAGIRRYQGDPPDMTHLARGLVADPAAAAEPFHLLGVGAGGLLAFELARALRELGRAVPFLVVAGAAPPHERPRGWLDSLTRGLRGASASPLRGPCGIILTRDLPKDAEARWLELAPDALCLSLDCRHSDLLGAAAEMFASAINSFASTADEHASG